MQVNFDNTYQRDLEGFYVPWQGVVAPAPKTIKLNHTLAKELGLDLSGLSEMESAEIFSGSRMLGGAAPLAQVYAGHQFGGFTPQLGDGRALLLGELIDTNGDRQDIQLKGSGRTPFSRGGDGKAAIGPVLREYLVSEAMSALGVPTTRSLAAVTTGESVVRESRLPGAVLTRVASSHLRVGTFEFFASRGEKEKVSQLADYAIQRHYPELVADPDRYLLFLESVLEAQAFLVAKWMSIGFIHGVMNTDNTTISGETIDYGPCAFMDHYHPATVFSSIDTHGRYAYQNQPTIAVWNLTRLAETLLPLIDEEEERGIEKATGILNKFSDRYFGNWIDCFRQKLGLMTERQEDMELANALLKAMEADRVDFTQLFRSLADAASGNTKGVKSLFREPESIQAWLDQWQARLTEESVSEDVRRIQLEQVNPIYIPRNHLVEEALAAATENQDFSLFEKFLEVLASPYSRQAGLEEYANPAPDSSTPYQTFCGT